MKDIFSENGVSLSRLQSLAKVVRAGSIAQAADGETNTQTQLSRQITDLEKTLGLQLLDRTRKPYPPTDEARRLAEVCERFVRDVEEISGAARGLQRPITVGAGEVVIRELFIPKIGRQKKGQAAVTWAMRNLRWRKIQEGLAAEWLDVGIASGLEAGGPVKVAVLETYGYKLLLPAGEKPDKTGWNRLKDIPVAVLEGDGGFRRLLMELSRPCGVELKISAECTSYPQSVDFADVTGAAVFVPEYWWRRRKDWAARTHSLPGLEKHQRTLHLGWNRNVVKRRPEVAALVSALLPNGRKGSK